MNAFGIDKFSVQELTGTVLVHYNDKQIQKHQIVELLDLAIEKTEDFSVAPIDWDLPVSSASVVLSAATRFVPALAPVSAAVFLYSVIPSFKGAYDLLFKERRLAEHPRWVFHFTPTSGSWLNAVENFFSVLTRRAIRRGVFKSVADLQATIRAYLQRHNAEPTPFVWTKPAQTILAKLRRVPVPSD